VKPVHIIVSACAILAAGTYIWTSIDADARARDQADFDKYQREKVYEADRQAKEAEDARIAAAQEQERKRQAAEQAQLAGPDVDAIRKAVEVRYGDTLEADSFKCDHSLHPRYMFSSVVFVTRDAKGARIPHEILCLFSDGSWSVGEDTELGPGNPILRGGWAHSW